jgi:hypothetical protein
MGKRILDRSFKYVPASQTNIRKTFAKIRRELALRKAESEGVRLERQLKVANIGPRR